MAYNSISIKPYTKSHLELQREITLIELAPSPYFFVGSICLAYMKMFARFDENPAMTLQDIKETKRYGRTDAQMHGRTDAHTHGQRENSIPTTNKVCGGYKIFQFSVKIFFKFHCKLREFLNVNKKYSWLANCLCINFIACSRTILVTIK